MSRRDLRKRWVTEVLRSERIGDACRVLLLAMAQQMTDSGAVSMRRDDLAAILNRHPRRVAERMAEARQAGFLDLLAGGHRGRPVEYAAKIPAAGKGAGERHPIAGKGAGERTPGSAPFPRSADLDPERAPIQKQSASVSERLAVEVRRERRDDHHGSRAEREHGEMKDGIKGGWAQTPAATAAADLGHDATTDAAPTRQRRQLRTARTRETEHGEVSRDR